MEEENKSAEAESEDKINECESETVDFTARIKDLEDTLERTVAESEKNLARAKDLNTMHVRLQADFDNYKKRTNEQIKKVRDEGVADVMEKILPVVDVIDNALGMINDESVSQGVKMISRELENLMSTYGVTEIKALGKPFDPELHEAILRVPAEHEDMSGNVMEVFRKGYMIGDKVLRHSVVKVAE